MTQELPPLVPGRTGLTVTPLGYGAMAIHGSRIWGGCPAGRRGAQPEGLNPREYRAPGVTTEAF
jgi:hypothetical protein